MAQKEEESAAIPDSSKHLRFILVRLVQPYGDARGLP